MLGYLVYSLWMFEFYKLLEPSQNAARMLSRMVVWQDMDTWAYDQIYVGIAQTIAMAFLGTLLATVLRPVHRLPRRRANNRCPCSCRDRTVRRVLDVCCGWGLTS